MLPFIWQLMAEITCWICWAISLVGANTIACNLFNLRTTCSNVATVKTQVFPVPDLAWTIKSVTNRAFPLVSSCDNQTGNCYNTF